MAYKIMMKNKYTGATEDADDEIYETKSDAIAGLDNVISDYLEGADVLEMAGESFIDPHDFDFFIQKI